MVGETWVQSAAAPPPGAGAAAVGWGKGAEQCRGGLERGKFYLQAFEYALHYTALHYTAVLAVHAGIRCALKTGGWLPPAGQQKRQGGQAASTTNRAAEKVGQTGSLNIQPGTEKAGRRRQPQQPTKQQKRQGGQAASTTARVFAIGHPAAAATTAAATPIPQKMHLCPALQPNKLPPPDLPIPQHIPNPMPHPLDLMPGLTRTKAS